jgi:ABC-type multidrug transport system fused ATPase/permease subunit
VVLSKICKTSSPLLLQFALECLSLNDSTSAVNWLVLLVLSKLFAMVFTEMRYYVYNAAKRAAKKDTYEEAFSHVMRLSYDWHLKKKMGSVLRALDRGVGSCDAVVSVAAVELGGWIVEVAINF